MEALKQRQVLLVVLLVGGVVASAVGLELFLNSPPSSPNQQVPLSFTYTVSGNTYTFSAADGFSGYSWDFGDSSTGNGASVSHTYLDNGTYTVALTASPLVGSVSPVSTSQRLAVTVVGLLVHHYFEVLNVTVGNSAT